MNVQANSEVAALKIHLNELKSEMDQVMRNGGSFEQCKDIHLRIKYLECQINVMEWQPLAYLSGRLTGDERRNSSDSGFRQ